MRPNHLRSAADSADWPDLALYSYDTTGVYGDDAFSDPGDLSDRENGEADDEWDLDKYRAETLAERERTERERIEKLGGAVATLSVG